MEDHLQISPAGAKAIPGKEQQAAGYGILLQIMMLVLSFVIGHVLRRRHFYYIPEASASLLIGNFAFRFIEYESENANMKYSSIFSLFCISIFPFFCAGPYNLTLKMPNMTSIFHNTVPFFLLDIVQFHPSFSFFNANMRIFVHTWEWIFQIEVHFSWNLLGTSLNEFAFVVVGSHFRTQWKQSIHTGVIN